MGASEKLGVETGNIASRTSRRLGATLSLPLIPLGMVAVVVANTAYLGVRLGSREEKLDTVATSVGKIEAEMYRRTDAEKDRQVIDLKIDNLDRRVSILESARQHQVSVVQARQEKQEDDILSRAWHSIAGGKK